MRMTRRERLVWSLSAASACGLLSGFVWLLSRPPGAPAGLRATSPMLVVEMAAPDGADGVLRDEAVLRDPRPLFLPTALNASLPEPLREAGKALFELDRGADEIGENDALIIRDLPPVALLNGRSANVASGVDALAATQGEVGVAGIGRGPRVIEPLPARGAFLEVVSAATGSTVLVESLAPSLVPAGRKSWEPLEILAVVDAGGLSVPLIVVNSSTIEEVDGHFRQVLAQVFRIGDRLPPGVFRLVIGP